MGSPHATERPLWACHPAAPGSRALPDRTVADDAHVGFGNSEGLPGFQRRLLVIEGHDDDRTFALFQLLDAAGELLVVETRHGSRVRHEVAAEGGEQLLLTLGAAPQVEHGHPARAQDEVGELVRILQASGAQRFEHFQQDLLNEISAADGDRR